MSQNEAYYFVRKNVRRFNKFIFGDVNLSNKVILENIYRYPLPIIEARDTSIAGKHGKTFMNHKLGASTIQLTLRFIEDSYDALYARFREIAPAFYSKEPVKIVLRDNPEFYNLGLVIEASPIERVMETARLDLTITCYDPFAYSDGEVVTISNSDLITINNPGFEAEWTFEGTTQSAEQIKLTLNNDKYILIGGLVLTGNTLKIDSEKELVLLNNSNENKRLNFMSDFFLIPSGQSSLRVEGATGQLTYWERYIL